MHSKGQRSPIPFAARSSREQTELVSDLQHLAEHCRKLGEIFAQLGDDLDSKAFSKCADRQYNFRHDGADDLASEKPAFVFAAATSRSISPCLGEPRQGE